MQGGVHPAAFGFYFGQNPPGLLLKSCYINGGVVVVGDETGNGAEVATDGTSGTPIGRAQAHVAKLMLNFVFGFRIGVTAKLSRHAGHARTRKAIEHDVAGLRVVQNVAHDGRVRHLGMVAVRVVDRVVFALTHVARIGFIDHKIRFPVWDVGLLAFPFRHKVI